MGSVYTGDLMNQLRTLTTLLVLLTTLAACGEEPTVIENRYTQTVTLKLGVCLENDVRYVWNDVLKAQVEYPGSVEATYANDTLDCVLEAETCFGVYQCLGHDTSTACSSSMSFCEGATVYSCTVLNSSSATLTKAIANNINQFHA